MRRFSCVSLRPREQKKHDFPCDTLPTHLAHSGIEADKFNHIAPDENVPTPLLPTL